MPCHPWTRTTPVFPFLRPSNVTSLLQQFHATSIHSGVFVSSLDNGFCFFFFFFFFDLRWIFLPLCDKKLGMTHTNDFLDLGFRTSTDGRRSVGKNSKLRKRVISTKRQIVLVLAMTVKTGKVPGKLPSVHCPVLPQKMQRPVLHFLWQNCRRTDGRTQQVTLYIR